MSFLDFFKTKKLPQTSLHKQAVDQSAHFIIGLLIVGLAVGPHTLLSGFLAGLAIGCVREVSQGGEILNWGNALDITMWGLGGLMAIVLFA